MYTIIIIILITVIYFVIVGIKENETREAVERERRISNKKIADIHFQNIVQNELNKQNVLKGIHQNFILELENLDHINKAFIVDKILNIEMTYCINELDAKEFAENLVNSLNTTTEIDFVNVYDEEKIFIATANRKNI